MRYCISQADLVWILSLANTWHKIPEGFRFLTSNKNRREHSATLAARRFEEGYRAQWSSQVNTTSGSQWHGARKYEVVWSGMRGCGFDDLLCSTPKFVLAHSCNNLTVCTADSCMTHITTSLGEVMESAISPHQNKSTSSVTQPTCKSTI